MLPFGATLTSDTHAAVLGQLRECARRYRGECDRDAVLGVDTESLIRSAVALASPPEEHIDLIEALGVVYWYQSLSLNTGVGEDRLEAATRLFEIIASNGGSSSVPVPIRVRLGDVESDPKARRSGVQRAVELFERAVTTHEDDALDEAIHLFESSLTGSASADTFAAIMTNLCQARALRFQLHGAFDDIERAVQLGERAAAVASQGSARLDCGINLLLAMCTRYERCRDSDFDRIEELGSELLESVPSGDVQHARIASTLSDAFSARHAVTSTDEDLERSVEFAERAFSCAPTDDPNRATYQGNLSEGLLSRFYVHGEEDDLNRAILVARRAVEDHRSAAGPRMYAEVNLSNALQERFEWLGSERDIDEAIRAAESALAACRSSGFDLQIASTCVAGAYRARFLCTHRPADIDQAVNYLEEAFTNLAASDPRWITIALDLCDARRMQYEVLGQGDRERSEVIDRAIDVGRAAMQEVASDDARLAELTLNLGRAWRARWQNGDDRAGAATLEHMRQAARHRFGRPATRADAAREWGRAAVVGADWDQAIEAYQLAVELLALISPRSLGPTDQERRLSRFGGLASEAAAVCVEAGQFALAVELFEQGRGLLFSQALDTRTDVTALSGVEPALAARFTELRERLSMGPARVTGGAIDPRHERAARRAHADEFDRIVTEIRRVEGFERFLLPPPATELLEVAEHGPVVLVNVAELRSDALVLRRTGIDVVPLPRVRPRVVAEQVDAFFEAVEQVQDHGEQSEDTRVDGERQVTAVLAWLWESIARRVLERLGVFGQSPRDKGEPATCLWWCPSGSLSLLPLHAAGRYRSGRNGSQGIAHESVLDCVISSTVPTVRALQYARRDADAPADARLLIVADGRMSSVDVEVEYIQASWVGGVTVLGMPGAAPATRSAVVNALADHSWVHFACHGYSDANDPSSSTLEISSDPPHRVTVLDLVSAHHDTGELAFLSACETAKPGLSVVDECIHLAAACQLAGYRHVIATLWPVAGDDAASFSEKVYRFLRASSSVSRASHIGAAVHRATQDARLRYPSEPTRWACFVHVGS